MYPVLRNIRERVSERWGGKKGHLLNGTGITALGEKRETEARCILSDTIFLYLLEMLKLMAVPGVENLETLHVSWNERSW